jgi:hypothetical protein
MAERPIPYEYVCGSGHAIGAERPVAVCPVTSCRQPQLKRVGHGSRKAKAS